MCSFVMLVFLLGVGMGMCMRGGMGMGVGRGARVDGVRLSCESGLNEALLWLSFRFRAVLVGIEHGIRGGRGWEGYGGYLHIATFATL